MLKAAEQDWSKPRIGTQDQSTDSARPVELVRGKRHGGNAQAAEMDRQLSDDLHGVGMHRNAGFGAQLGQFLNRLQDARFVVAQHDADQPGVVVEQFPQMVDLHDSVARHADSLDVETESRQLFRGTDDAGMFDRRNNHASGRRPGEAQQGQVVCFGTAAGEQDPVSLHVGQVTAENPADRVSSLFEDASRLPAQAMLTGRVDMSGQMAFVDRLGHARVDARGGVVVQVDGVHARYCEEYRPWTASRDLWPGSGRACKMQQGPASKQTVLFNGKPKASANRARSRLRLAVKRGDDADSS